MKLKTILRSFFLVISIGGGILSSCTEEAIQPEKDFALYYPSINEIAPGSVLGIFPSWNCGKPTDFAISGVKLDGEQVTTELFVINPESGEFRIENSENASIGVYQVSISCKVDGTSYSFSDIIRVKMMKPVPESIKVEPSQITAKLSDIAQTTDPTVLPTAKVIADGDDHVIIKDYFISNVYKDGALANECKDWFEISDDGVFSIVGDNADFETGVYKFDLKLTTYIVDQNSEEGVYSEALTLVVTSQPLGVAYPVTSVRVEAGLGGVSLAPVYQGSPDGLKYEIKSVSPSDPGITIDSATGVITLPEGTSVSVGEEYLVSLKVSNDFGTADFDDVFKFVIIDFINPISEFSYKNVENISGVSFSNEVALMDGDEVTYSLKTLPEALSDLKFDPTTGEISSDQGVELPIGEYTITVVAKNSKGEKETSFVLNVVENPNYFTYVLWGNNLGPDGTALKPLSKYGNQFRLFHDSDSPLKIEIQESDIPKGRPVTFEYIKLTTPSGGTPTGSNMGVQPSGRLDIYKRTSGYTTTFGIVKVTVGEGNEAISRKIPVFADLCGYVDNHQILWTPFVIRVNPKTGGVSAPPVITKKDADGNITDVTKTATIDYRTNSYFFNLNGPEEHTFNDKLQNDSNKESFLVDVWQRYLTAAGVVGFNAYHAGPTSYWYNRENGLLDHAALYVDESDGKKIKVNPEKFKDEEGNYADGVFMGTMNFKAAGGNPIEGTNNVDYVQVNRVFIWLDPDYVENN